MAISDMEQQRINLFLTRFTEIEEELKHACGNGVRLNARPSAVEMIRQYEQKHGGWHDGNTLRKIADLRNVIVHERHSDEYLAVPTDAVIASLQKCLERLHAPKKVAAMASSGVRSVSPEDSLLDAFRLMLPDFSQLPVLRNQVFCGLLTENGIVRWLTGHVTGKLEMVAFDEVCVDEVLNCEEAKFRVQFTSPDTHAADVCAMFTEDKQLEAVLVTHRGSKTEKIQGIVTRWDVAGFKE